MMSPPEHCFTASKSAFSAKCLANGACPPAGRFGTNVFDDPLQLVPPPTGGKVDLPASPQHKADVRVIEPVNKDRVYRH